MPNIPTYTRRAPGRVIGPALTDPSGARVESDAPARGAANKARGEQNLWRGVQQLGVDITNFVDTKIKENETLKNNNARIQSSARRQVAEREIEIMKTTTHHSLWGEKTAEILNKASADISVYNANATEKHRNEDRLMGQGWNSIMMTNAAVGSAKVYKSETIGNQEKQLAITAAKYGTDSPITQAEIQATQDVYSQFGEGQETSDFSVAKILETSQKQYDESRKASAEDALLGMIEPILKGGSSWAKDQKISKEDRRVAYAAISEAVDDLVEQGVYTKAEGFQLKKDMNNDIDNYAEEFTYKAATAKDETLIDTYSSLADKMVEGTFTNDDVVLAKAATNDDSRAFWNAVQDGYRAGANSETTFEGNEVVMNIVTGIPENKVGVFESLKQLMNARYVEKSISDEQFKLAVQQIKDPYPKHIAETLNYVNKEGTKDKGFLYFRGAGFLGNDYLDEDEKNLHAKVMKNTMYWMEDEKKATGKYPESEAIYKKYRESGILIEPPKAFPKAPTVQKAPPKRDDALFVGVDDDDKFNSLDVGTMYFEEALNTWVRKVRN